MTAILINRQKNNVNNLSVIASHIGYDGGLVVIIRAGGNSSL